MDDSFSQFKAHNESKNIFKAARTPAVFFAIAVTMYILSGIFGLFGLYALANACNLIMGVGLLTLVLWAYIRYVKYCNYIRYVKILQFVTIFYYPTIRISKYLLLGYYLGTVENSEKSEHK